MGNRESNSSLIKICKLSKTILTTLAPFQHGYRSSVLIFHRSFSNVYNLFFTSSKNSHLVSISNLPYGLSYFSTRRLFRLIYVEPRFENILYFLQTEDTLMGLNFAGIKFRGWRLPRNSNISRGFNFADGLLSDFSRISRMGTPDFWWISRMGLQYFLNAKLGY